MGPPGGCYEGVTVRNDNVPQRQLGLGTQVEKVAGVQSHFLDYGRGGEGRALEEPERQEGVSMVRATGKGARREGQQQGKQTGNSAGKVPENGRGKVRGS